MSGRAIVACACVAASAVALDAQQALRHRFERPIVTSAPGPQRVLPDIALLAGAQPFDQIVRNDDGASRARAYGGMSDLRLYGADGRELPYLLLYPPVAEPHWVRAAVLPLVTTEKTSGFEADLGTQETVDALRVRGLPAPFLKRLVLEGSGDRQRWTMLAPEATLFALPDEGLNLETVPFRPGPYRYLRVTWNDANSRRLPLPTDVSARRTREDVVEPPRLTAEVVVESRPSEPETSRYRIRLPAPRLPIVALALDVGEVDHVFRRATVTESRLTGLEAVPAEIGRATLSRVVRDGVAAAALRVPLAPPQETEIDLLVENGSNPPLAVVRAVVELAELPWVYFEAPAGAVTARYGDRQARRPQYDLEAARDSIRLGSVPEAKWGGAPTVTTSESSPAPAAPSPGAPLDASGFRYQRVVPNAPPQLAVVPLDAAVLAHSRRFADVRLLDQHGRQVPYLIERRAEPLAIELALAAHQPKARELRADDRRLSTYVVRLPFAELPPAQLVLETSARVFNRSLRVGFERPPDRQRREPWFDEAAHLLVWQHSRQENPAPAFALDLRSASEQELVLVVDEGDNSPLPITSVRLLLPSYRLRFYHPGTPLRLVYGHDDIAPPQYDLALLAPHVMGAEATEISAAAETAHGAGATRGPLVSPWTFWIGLTVAVVILLGLIVRLVTRTP